MYAKPRFVLRALHVNVQMYFHKLKSRHVQRCTRHVQFYCNENMCSQRASSDHRSILLRLRKF